MLSSDLTCQGGGHFTDYCSITIKSLHMDLLIHIFLGGMQMFCGHNCNYNNCNYVLYRGLRQPGNVFYHNKASSYRSTHSYFWVVCRCSVGTIGS